MNKVICNIANRWCTLIQSIDKHEYISFDIFDTLIIRKCGNPKFIFKLVENKYNRFHDVKICDFYNNRIKAEISARKNSKRKEISLEDIYKFVSDFYDIKTAGKLKELELETELEQCTVRKEIIDLYNTTIQKKKVIIASDMYLSLNFIKSILANNNIIIPNNILISSECEATKRDGSMFKLIRNHFNCSPSQILHIGDNIKSDFLMAQLNGLHSYLLYK